jgi:hypothetical protein
VGKHAVQAFIQATLFSGDAHDRWKLTSIHANGQPGFAFYRLDESTPTYHPFALQVLTLLNDRISTATTFGFPSLFHYFNLPPILST